VLLLSLWLIRKSWRFLRGLLGRLRQIFSGRPDPGVTAPAFPLKKPRSGDGDPPHV